MKLTNIVFCLMLLGSGLTSCIREDLDDCFSTNKLVLSYKGCLLYTSDAADE